LESPICTDFPSGKTSRSEAGFFDDIWPRARYCGVGNHRARPCGWGGSATIAFARDGRGCCNLQRATSKGGTIRSGGGRRGRILGHLATSRASRGWEAENTLTAPPGATSFGPHPKPAIPCAKRARLVGLGAGRGGACKRGNGDSTRAAPNGRSAWPPKIKRGRGSKFPLVVRKWGGDRFFPTRRGKGNGWLKQKNGPPRY